MHYKRARRRGFAPNWREMLRKPKGPVSLETRLKISATLKARGAGPPTGEDHPNWKGDDAGYSAKHSWRRVHVPKRGRCGDCGSIGPTHWANLSGEYRRADPSDWRELCVDCHNRFDRGRLAS